MTMFMETTRINAERTVGEIHDVLRRHGANAILNEYEVANVSAVSFKTLVGGQEVAFRLPARWKELETYLRGTGKKPKHPDTYETWARRVAWRQILRWVEAQFALVETGMVKIQEVFLPYAQTESGETLFERIEKKGLASIEYKGH
jgi:hypothetical protein